MTQAKPPKGVQAAIYYYIIRDYSAKKPTFAFRQVRTRNACICQSASSMRVFPVLIRTTNSGRLAGCQ